MNTQPPAEEPEASGRPQDADSFTVLTVAFELFLIPAAWFLAWILPGPGVPAAQCTVEGFLLGILAALPLLLFLGALNLAPLKKFAPLRAIRRRLRRLLGPSLKDLHIWQALLISAAAGIGEEVLFRGAIQARAGLLLASLIFGLLHWITPFYAVLAALIGAYLGWVFWMTGNLLVPIIAHGLYDFVALLVFRNEVRRQVPPITSESKPS